ncbi:ATP-dependent RecD-like DNA helicase [Bacteroidota bacterium]
MTIINGIVKNYIYYNDENGYSVIKFEDKTIVVGILPKFVNGDNLELSGKWTNHPKFGKQFKVENYKVIYPTNETGIIKYLGSGLIKGIGEKTANRIVTKFGKETLEIIENDINKLLEVEGIGQKKLEDIKKGWQEQQRIKEVMLFLQSHGISTAYSLKIFKTYGDNAPEIIRKDPYQLVQDIWGIGFKTADDIAKKFGFTDNDPSRIKAGVKFLLLEYSKNGHTYVPQPDLIESCSQLLNFELSYSDRLFNEMEIEKLIIIERGRVYLSELFFAERKIESSIENMLSIRTNLTPQYKRIIQLIERKYSKEQLEAIKLSMELNFLIITGGPGTGKTTTLKGIIDIFKNQKKKILLAAPTGRASKRMTEVIGLKARTIHRLLDFNPSDNSFGYNKFNRLDTDLLIIDELSMIDTYLMYHLITAINEKTKVIFVGDADQLPSIGPGNILRDLIESEKIPCITLNKVFRQAETSNIIVNAHKINSGELPVLKQEKITDFIFFEETNNSIIQEKILHLCKFELPERLKLDPRNDIQVISPMYKGAVGVNELNFKFQQHLNLSPVIFTKGERTFKANDKIMQLRNNYEKGVFNGDIGYLIGYNNEKKMLNATFNDRIVQYSVDEVDEITLAFAITVHKSQGSEYPCVIMPITVSHYIMLQRNLFYTAVTRASKLFILFGTKRAVAIAVKNNKVERRFTTLFKR